MLQVASKDAKAEDQLLSILRKGGDERHAVLLGKAAVEALGGFVGVVKKGFRVRYSASDPKLHHRFHCDSNFCPPETYDSGIIIVDVYRTEMVEVVNLHTPLKRMYRLRVSDVQLFFGEVCYDRIPTTLAHKLVESWELLTRCRFCASPEEKTARRELADRKERVAAQARAKAQCEVIRSALGNASAALKPSWRKADTVSGGKSSLHNHPMKLSPKHDWSCNGQRENCLGGQGPACYACANGCSFHLCAACFHETETSCSTREMAGYDRKKWSRFLSAGPGDLVMDTASDLSSDSDTMSSPKMLATLSSSDVKRTEESPPDKNDSESEDLARAILMTTTSTTQTRISDKGDDNGEEDEESMALAEALRLSLGVEEGPESRSTPKSTLSPLNVNASAPAPSSTENSTPSTAMLVDVNGEEKDTRDEEDTKTADGDDAALSAPALVINGITSESSVAKKATSSEQEVTTKPRCRWWRPSRARTILAALQSVTARLMRSLLLSPLSKNSVAQHLLQQRPSFVAHLLMKSGDVCDVVDLPYSSARGISSAILQAIALLEWLPNEDILVRDFATASAANATKLMPSISSASSTDFNHVAIVEELAKPVSAVAVPGDMLDVRGIIDVLRLLGTYFYSRMGMFAAPVDCNTPVRACDAIY